MADLIVDGWLHIGNGTDWMKLACREIKWDRIRNPEISHYEGGFSFGYDMGKKWLVVKVSGMIFETNADVNIFNVNLDSWLDSGPILLKIQRTKAGAFEDLIGTHETVQVLVQKGWSDITKIEHEDGETYEIGKIVFEQAGMSY